MEVSITVPEKPQTNHCSQFMMFVSCYSRLLRCHAMRSEEHTSELQSQSNLVCRLLLEKKKKNIHADVVHRHCDICNSHHVTQFRFSRSESGHRHAPHRSTTWRHDIAG